jgi:hypothetical protein
MNSISNPIVVLPPEESTNVAKKDSTLERASNTFVKRVWEMAEHGTLVDRTFQSYYNSVNTPSNNRRRTTQKAGRRMKKKRNIHTKHKNKYAK